MAKYIAHFTGPWGEPKPQELRVREYKTKYTVVLYHPKTYVTYIFNIRTGKVTDKSGRKYKPFIEYIENEERRTQHEQTDTKRAGNP